MPMRGAQRERSRAHEPADSRLHSSFEGWQTRENVKAITGVGCKGFHLYRCRHGHTWQVGIGEILLRRICHVRGGSVP